MSALPIDLPYTNMTAEELARAVLEGGVGTTPLEVILASKIRDLLDTIDGLELETLAVGAGSGCNP